jgi:hypothetical protein
MAAIPREHDACRASPTRWHPVHRSHPLYHAKQRVRGSTCTARSKRRQRLALLDEKRAHEVAQQARQRVARFGVRFGRETRRGEAVCEHGETVIALRCLAK